MHTRTIIKTLLAQRCITITKLAELMSKKTVEIYTFQRISHKLRLERLTMKETYIIAEILDYKIEFIDLKK